MVNDKNLAVIVLAAGLGKRMKSSLPKVLVEVNAKPMILRILSAVAQISPRQVTVVVGHLGELVRDTINDWIKVQRQDNKDKKLDFVTFAIQAEQRGTGNAALCAYETLKEFSGTILILPGDIPLVDPTDLDRFISYHSSSDNTLSILSTEAKDPSNYGRILRDQNGVVSGIVEEKDASCEQRKINEINSSVYAVDAQFLWKALAQVRPSNAQDEYYLTDIVAIGANAGVQIGAFKCKDNTNFSGVNSRKEIAMVEGVLNKKVISKLIDQGIIICSPESTLIGEEVQIESGVRIGPNVQIIGNTKIAAGVVIEGTAYIKDSLIGADVHLKLGVRVEDSSIGKGTSVGPFANIRPGTILGTYVKIGNFVEVKKSTFQQGAKANHLAYIGDSEIGQNANIGAGTITCNYDGYKKSKTVVEADAFIGSNSVLVAPVTVGQGAFVGAGSTITKDVEADSLALTRVPQQTKPGWAKRRRDLLEKKK